MEQSHNEGSLPNWWLMIQFKHDAIATDRKSITAKHDCAKLATADYNFKGPFT